MKRHFTDCAVCALSLSIVGLAIAFFANAGEKKDAPKLKLAEQAGELSGIYRCEGAEAGGQKYSGAVTIHRRGDVYVVAWLVNGSSFTGIGIRQNDTLAVGWGMQGEKGLLRGVNVYRIDGKKLAGRWTTLPGPGAVQPETLTWISDHAAEKDSP